MIIYDNSAENGQGNPSTTRIVLRPNRSLTPKGLAWFMLIVWGMLMVPMIPLLGMKALWVLFPFMLAVLLALKFSFSRSNRDGELFEELTLTADLVKVFRHNPRADDQDWQASPYWTTLKIKAEGGPVENYITLKGAGREIELGAFLSPDERAELFKALEKAFAKTRNPVSF